MAKHILENFRQSIIKEVKHNNFTGSFMGKDWRADINKYNQVIVNLNGSVFTLGYEISGIPFIA